MASHDWPYIFSIEKYKLKLSFHSAYPQAILKSAVESAPQHHSARYLNNTYPFHLVSATPGLMQLNSKTFLMQFVLKFLIVYQSEKNLSNIYLHTGDDLAFHPTANSPKDSYKEYHDTFYLHKFLQFLEFV